MELTREMLTAQPVEQTLAREGGVRGPQRRLVVHLDLTTNGVWFSVNEKRHDWLSDAIDAYNEITS